MSMAIKPVVIMDMAQLVSSVWNALGSYILMEQTSDQYMIIVTTVDKRCLYLMDGVHPLRTSKDEPYLFSQGPQRLLQHNSRY